MGKLKSVNDICDLLMKYDIGPTQQRIRIAQVLCSEPCHLSAEQVLDGVNQEVTYVSKATIYNTLNLFVGKGLIQEVIVDPHKVFYDSTTTPHFHFYNEDSGELLDINEHSLAFQAQPKPPKGTELASIDVVIRIRNSS